MRTNTEGRDPFFIALELRKENKMEENKTNATHEHEHDEGHDEAEKTYTQEEFEAALQAETDRRVTSALKKAEEKNTKKVREAEKLARMNEQQRFEYDLEQKEIELAEKERRLTLAENSAEASKILGEKGLSHDLVGFVVAEDAETMKDNIDRLDRAFKASVKAEVEKRLASSTPKKNLPVDRALTREQFLKMTITEQTELYKNNPELYTALATPNYDRKE